MKEINERPVCHRAEDLVTYLYNEANEAEARDFAKHAEACEACRAELAVFQQVHESILLWRNDALGSAFSAATLPLPATETRVNSMQPAQRRLSALAALREFFSVSPLWLRGATAFAAVMLCVLAVLAISRSWNRAPQLASSPTEQKVYTEAQFKEVVAKQVNERLAEITRPQNSTPPTPEVADNAGQRTTSGQPRNRTEVAGNSISSKQQRARGLTRAEREQLATDLRLISRDDEELPFGLSEEPDQ